MQAEIFIFTRCHDGPVLATTVLPALSHRSKNSDWFLETYAAQLFAPVSSISASRSLPTDSTPRFSPMMVP